MSREGKNLEGLGGLQSGADPERFSRGSVDAKKRSSLDRRRLSFPKGDQARSTAKSRADAAKNKELAEKRLNNRINLNHVGPSARREAYRQWLESQIRDENPRIPLEKIHKIFQDELRVGGELSLGAQKRTIRELLDQGRISREQYNAWMLYLSGEGPYPEEDDDIDSEQTQWDRTIQESGNLEASHEQDAQDGSVVELDVEEEDDDGFGQISGKKIEFPR